MAPTFWRAVPCTWQAARNRRSAHAAGDLDVAVQFAAPVPGRGRQARRTVEGVDGNPSLGPISSLLFIWIEIAVLRSLTLLRKEEEAGIDVILSQV